MNLHRTEAGDRVGDTIYRRGANGAWWWGRVVWIQDDVMFPVLAVDRWVTA